MADITVTHVDRGSKGRYVARVDGAVEPWSRANLSIRVSQVG